MTDAPDRGATPEPQPQPQWEAPAQPPRPAQWQPESAQQPPAQPTQAAQWQPEPAQQQPIPAQPQATQQRWQPEAAQQPWQQWPPAPQPGAPVPRPPRAPKPPRKWFGAWGGLWLVLGCVAVIALELIESWALRGVSQPAPRDYDVLDPTLMFIAGAAVNAGFLYTMAYRLRPEWRLTPVRLVAGGLLAGFLAGIIAGMVNSLIAALSGGTNADPGTLSFALVGFVEESAKLGAALLLGRALPFKNGRIGLFVGAAVGFGFASVENFGYLQVAWSVGLAHNDALGATFGTSIVRQLMGPLLHPVMTGLSTAAVFASSRAGRYRLTWGVVGAWLAVACAHSLFDLGSSFGGGIAVLVIALYLIGAFIAWLLISRALKRRDEVRLGIRQPPGPYPLSPVGPR